MTGSGSDDIIGERDEHSYSTENHTEPLKNEKRKPRFTVTVVDEPQDDANQEEKEQHFFYENDSSRQNSVRCISRNSSHTSFGKALSQCLPGNNSHTSFGKGIPRNISTASFGKGLSHCIRRNSSTASIPGVKIWSNQLQNGEINTNRNASGESASPGIVIRRLLQPPSSNHKKETSSFNGYVYKPIDTADDAHETLSSTVESETGADTLDCAVFHNNPDSEDNKDLDELTPKEPIKLAKRGIAFAKRYKRRLVQKNGECNVIYTKIRERKRRFLLDIFTTLIELRWRYIILLFIASFILTWVLFALVWWQIAFLHGDKDEAMIEARGLPPCVDGVTDFVSALLFSVETMHTIGYGTRAITKECPFAVALLMLQSCFGVIVQSIMTGLVFAKIARPKNRGQTMMFSEHAVINKRDGHLCMSFRVGDMRRSKLVNATIRAIMVRKHVTAEGEVLPLEETNFPVFTETGDCNILLAWPVTIYHVIDEESPLYTLSAENLLSAQFEIIVILEGTVESTGMTTQIRTSYLPSEILWGSRLCPLMTYQKDGRYHIDHSKFDATETIDLPDTCAKEQCNAGMLCGDCTRKFSRDFSFLMPEKQVKQYGN